MIQLSPAGEKPRSRWIAGVATVTMLPSRIAISIVVDRTPSAAHRDRSQEVRSGREGRGGPGGLEGSVGPERSERSDGSDGSGGPNGAVFSWFVDTRETVTDCFVRDDPYRNYFVRSRARRTG